MPLAQQTTKQFNTAGKREREREGEWLQERRREIKTSESKTTFEEFGAIEQE